MAKLFFLMTFLACSASFVVTSNDCYDKTYSTSSSSTSSSSTSNTSGSSISEQTSCNVNERYVICPAGTCQPKKCSELGFPVVCPIIGPNGECPGTPACICIDGYLRNDRGICVPQKQCPSCGGDYNAESGCGIFCNRCQGPIPCPKICRVNGCDCKPNTVYDQNIQKCVPKNKCTPVCGNNEIFSNCTNGGCQARNCTELGNPVKCVKLAASACIKGCVCKENYLRAPNGTCVPEDKCGESLCPGKNQILGFCAPSCPPSCAELLGKEVLCLMQAAVCRTGCQCVKDYYRNNVGDCVTKEECLNCTGPHEYYACGVYCDNVCATLDKENQTNCPIINKKCNEKCYCEEGYARDQNNICILIAECKKVAEAQGNSTANATEAQIQLEQGNIAFTGNFFNEVVKSKQGTSVIMSPFSVLVPWGQLALYASGDSFDQLSTALNLKTKNEIRVVYPALMESVRSQKNIILNLAQKVWANEKFELSDAFKNDSRVIFGAEAENVNFSQPQEAADLINAWVEAQTNNLIKDLVSPNLFNELTRLVLTNAIYFKGDWVHQFNANATTERDFHVSNNKTVKVQTMYQSGSFNYAESEDLDAQILELPYKGGNITFLAILPRTIEGLLTLVDKLKSSTTLKAVTNSLQRQKVQIHLPIIEINTALDLKDILIKINITNIFNRKDSGLDGILKLYEPLFVSAAIQKAFIIVNEKGSEVAAANAFVLEATITSVGIPELIKIFDADHPFLFYILLKGNPIFCGTYTGK